MRIARLKKWQRLKVKITRRTRKTKDVANQSLTLSLVWLEELILKRFTRYATLLYFALIGFSIFFFALDS